MDFEFPILDAHDELKRIGRTVNTELDEESLKDLKEAGQIDGQYRILLQHILNIDLELNPCKKRKDNVTMVKKRSKAKVDIDNDDNDDADDDGNDAEEENDPHHESLLKHLKERGIGDPEAKNTREGECTGSDSDVQILDEASCLMRGELNPFVSSKTFVEIIENGVQDLEESSEFREFRKVVINILKKPFDTEEYRRLQEAIKTGKYFDYHPDLRQKLTEYRYNRRKRLSILRGFFFWLQNLTQKGAFKPWTDRACLEVESQEDAKKA